MSDLADRWDVMTAREKDAEVALAKGLEVWHEQGNVIGRRYGTLEVVSGVEGLLAYYSTSWADAGLLIEELATPACCVRLIGGEGLTWFVQLETAAGLLEAEGDTAPDAIALAYCLAKGAAPSISKP